MRPFSDDVRARTQATRPGPGLPHRDFGRSAAVVGIVDDGLAFAHERFQEKDGKTRIHYFWNQGYPVPPESLMKTKGRPGYGWEFTNADIEWLIPRCSRRGLVDEDLVYRTAKYGEVARFWAHGTHVMDLASGLDPRDVDDWSSRIIGVQIQPPSRTTRDRSSGWLASTRSMDFDTSSTERTSLAPPDLPVVVNLSFGHIAGPHDGSSMLERRSTS